MTPDELDRLRRHIAQFTLKPTLRGLGEAGSRFELEATQTGCTVRVWTGFPIERSRAQLVADLGRHIAGLDPDLSVDIETQWAVETHAVQHGIKPIEGVSNVIAVASGKGGVGKSTLAVNFALGLAQEGARVGLLDADIYGPSQPTMLGLEGRRPETRDGKMLEPLEAHGIVAMSIGFLVDQRQPMAWRGPMVTSALNQLLTQTRWGELDYLFVDMPPGTGDIQLTLAQRVPVSGAVIVTTPQDVALADARKALEMFQKVNVPVLGIVENMSLHICSQCGHEDAIFGSHGGSHLSEEYHVPLLGQLPIDRGIRESTDGGQPSAATDPDGILGSKFREVALRVAGELAATAKDYSRLFPKITVEET